MRLSATQSWSASEKSKKGENVTPLVHILHFKAKEFSCSKRSWEPFHRWKALS